MFFISIIAIFVSAFGVTTQATLYPGNELSFDLLRSILDKAYWPIYGEMKLLDEIENCPNENNKDCPDTTGIAFSFIALMVYMVIANVLLINLLIAMFR
jgi:transient receptor potential cation channel subfamily M protein 3